MSRLYVFLALVAAGLSLPVVAWADDLLTEVPGNAIGFVLVNSLSELDAKVGQVAALLEREVPRPLSVLRDAAGVNEGLNPNGSAMLALFATSDNQSPLQYCLWLPVSDYEAFLKSLKATTIDGVAAASIAGEDLVIARRGDWALVMDPDQRDRIAQLADASPSPPDMPGWKSWIQGNDVTVVAFGGGVRALLETGGVTPTAEQTPTLQANSATLDTDVNRRAGPRHNRTPADVLENAKLEVRKWLRVAPQVVENLQQARAVACGLRLDAGGNAAVSVRVALSQQASGSVWTDGQTAATELPAALYGGGGFVLNAAGRLPPAVLAGCANVMARSLAADLRDEERTVLDESAYNRMMQAAEQASAEIQSFAVLIQPGEEPQPVYSNNFAAARVASASTFVEHAHEVMRLWNSASREAKGETRMVFDVEETKVGERPATLYSLDLAALEGGAVAPEVRQAMEQLFGPQGKLRLWIVPTDDHTVLLAVATTDQMTAVLKVIDQKRPIEWNRGEVSETHALLPPDADVRAFVDLHRYFDSERRKMMAIIGVPVIGGPLVRGFPASPPVGLAGAFRDGELRLDAAMLAPTLKSADGYLSAGRSRGTSQIRPRAVPGQPVPAPVPAPPAPEQK